MIEATSMDQSEELGRWLASADARAATRSDLRRHGLPHDPLRIDDVLGEVTLRVLARLTEHPIDGAVSAYARRAVSNAVVDLLRGRHDVSLDELLERGGAPGSEADDEKRNATDDAAVEPDGLTGVRRGLHCQLANRHVQPWRISAALVVVVLSDDDVAIAPDIPQPDTSHGNPGQPELWAGLAYAGQDRCFAQPETPAVRQRRSQALQRVRESINRVLDTTGRSAGSTR